MYVVNFRAIAKISKKKKKKVWYGKRKWNHTKCSIKIIKARKGGIKKKKRETMNTSIKWKIAGRMVVINPAMSIITLSVIGLNTSSNRDCQGGSKNKAQLHVAYKKCTWNRRHI